METPWAAAPDLPEIREIPGRALPGGNESFMTTARPDSATALYPQLKGLGPLNYTGVHPQLLNVLDQLSSGLVSGALLKASLFQTGKPYIQSVLVYRLSLLGEVKTVYFSKPLMSESDMAEVTYRITTGSGTAALPVFLKVFLRAEGSQWTIREIIFDVESYEAAVIAH